MSAATKKALKDAWREFERSFGLSFELTAKKINALVRADERAEILATPIDIKVEHHDECAVRYEDDAMCDCKLDDLRAAYILAQHRIAELEARHELTDLQRIEHAAELLKPLADRLLAPDVVEAAEGLLSDLETIVEPAEHGEYGKD